jgi:hypothetical protein
MTCCSNNEASTSSGTCVVKLTIRGNQRAQGPSYFIE